jgi:NADH:ubiquinone oxidoreductase subunit B-like Fe-S oxidoreductase
MSLLERSQLGTVQPVKFILNWGRRYSLWLLNFGWRVAGSS